jgi:hypothetical protein
MVIVTMRSYIIFNSICLALCAIFGLGTVLVVRGTSSQAYVAEVIRGVPILERNKELGIRNNGLGNNERLKNNEQRTTSNEQIEQKALAEIPKSINLKVPFTSQAPEKNWDQPWQDACEEAAVLMLDAYYKKYNLSPLFAKDEILKSVKWQEEQGWGTSIEIEKIKQLAEEFQISNFRFRIAVNPTIEDIKSFVASGNPVLVVADGHALPNPFFSGDGPDYHALIIRGYTEDSFITNDPGTYRGENFVYKYESLMGAIHDWNNGDVENGKRVVLVLQ